MKATNVVLLLGDTTEKVETVSNELLTRSRFIRDWSLPNKNNPQSVQDLMTDLGQE